jgi:hypothetical protein
MENFFSHNKPAENKIKYVWVIPSNLTSSAMCLIFITVQNNKFSAAERKIIKKIDTALRKYYHLLSNTSSLGGS